MEAWIEEEEREYNKLKAEGKLKPLPESLAKKWAASPFAPLFEEEKKEWDAIIEVLKGTPYYSCYKFKRIDEYYLDDDWSSEEALRKCEEEDARADEIKAKVEKFEVLRKAFWAKKLGETLQD